MQKIFKDKPDLETYIAKYNVENILFNEIGPKARKEGKLTFRNFLKIGLWKSFRQKPNYMKNKDTVEKITQEAFLENDEAKKINLLCQLKGVSIPTASAILAVVYPDKYPVIDIRCLETLVENEYEINSTSPTVKTWLYFLEITRGLAKEFNTTPREIDMALFALHAEKNWDKTLYSKKTGIK